MSHAKLKDVFDGKDLSKIYSDHELKNVGFSIQRIMSIKYPLQAQAQNVLGVNMIGVVKYWSVEMKGKYNYLPKWTTIATAKLRKEYQEKVGEFKLLDKEIMNAFMAYYYLDRHELDFLIKTKPKEMSEMLSQYKQNYGI